MDAAVTEPPCGKSVKVIKLSAVATDVKIIISASNLVG
jgi:hypothetical protein